MPSSSFSQEDNYVQFLLVSARPYLRGELHPVDEKLPSLVGLLRSVGAGECWHKFGSFLDHLPNVYRILKLWKLPDAVALCGFFHSAYSDSDINLAIFAPSSGRETVTHYVGEATERLIHLFCLVPRPHDDLICHYSDPELVEHLHLSEVSLRRAKEKGEFDGEEGWRKKLQSLLPASGITSKLKTTGEEVTLSRRMVAAFLCITMADYCEQFFSYQDDLFENSNGRLELSGENWGALWPGEVKPGLWVNFVSRMGALYNLIAREEEIFMEERKRKVVDDEVGDERDEDIELVMPPVFERCTRVLDAVEQIEARDLYWQAVCDSEGAAGAAEELLRRSIEKNPFVGEPYVVLAQVYLSKGKYEQAVRDAENGLTLLLEWGSSWDKRMSWEGWISWARVLLSKAKEKSWPRTSWGVFWLGRVK